MEKFSEFNDPLTGINPFIQPKQDKITIMTILRAFLKLPLYLLYKLGAPCLPLLLNIVIKTKIQPKRLIYCNKVSQFDMDIIRYVFKINTFGYIPNTTCVVFPESTNTNNKAILEYQEEECCDYVIGLKYSPETVYCYGNRIKWLIRFLGSKPAVEVKCNKGFNLSELTGLPKVKLTKKDKERFMQLIESKM